MRKTDSEPTRSGRRQALQPSRGAELMPLPLAVCCCATVRLFLLLSPARPRACSFVRPPDEHVRSAGSVAGRAWIYDFTCVW